MHIICCLLITALLSVFMLPLYNVDALPNSSPPPIQQSNMLADFVEYDKKSQMIYAQGNIKLTTDEYYLTVDYLLYDIESDILWAEGNITIKDNNGKIIIGEKMVLRDKLKTGVIEGFIMSFDNDSLVVSKLAERISSTQSQLSYSRFTPCQIACNKNPIWQIDAKETKIDLDKNRMIYKHVFFNVYGLPIFYTPYFSHPTPNAGAESGMLVPEVKNGGVGIPLYLRAKPNLDFTFTPRIFNKYQIFELETRYKPNKSDFINFTGSFGHLPYFLEKDGKKIKNRKVNSYHFIADGSFIAKNYQYGFRIERTSDKAYLKNYYQNNTPYLTSRIYLQNIKKADYLLVEGLYLQGLGINDSSKNDALVLPSIKTKNVIPLNEHGTNFVIKNNTLFYRQEVGLELARVSLDLSLEHHLFTSSGQILNFIIRDRGDAYFVHRPAHKKSGETITPHKRHHKELTRNIPEFQTIWRYPLVGAIADSSSIIIEPIASFTIGRKFHTRDGRFTFINPMKYELSEENIFSSNRYSGIDCHEFGNRLNYGVNSAISVNDNYLGLFVGQSRNTQYSFTKPASNTENVAKIYAQFTDQLELFYRFRKDANFKPIRDEIGGHFNKGKINFTSSFIQLRNIGQYYRLNDKIPINDRARQLYGGIGYQLTDNWSVGYSARVDFSKRGKHRLIAKTIKVTYFKDCVKISWAISSDYTYDNSRGIKKTTSSPTITIGLKVLNM